MELHLDSPKRDAEVAFDSPRREPRASPVLRPLELGCDSPPLADTPGLQLAADDTPDRAAILSGADGGAPRACAGRPTELAGAEEGGAW